MGKKFFLLRFEAFLALKYSAKALVPLLPKNGSARRSRAASVPAQEKKFLCAGNYIFYRRGLNFSAQGKKTEPQGIAKQSCTQAKLTAKHALMVASA